MTTVVDANEVYSRGLSDIAGLRDVERLVFILIEFETQMDLDGWDGS